MESMWDGCRINVGILSKPSPTQVQLTTPKCATQSHRRGWGGVGGANPYSCQTQLSLNCVLLFWGCLGVMLWLSCGFDNNLCPHGFVWKIESISTHDTYTITIIPIFTNSGILSFSHNMENLLEQIV